MYPIENKFYAPSLREKGGELRGIRWMDGVCREALLPIFVALPLSEKENAALSLEELVKREVGRVQSAWGADVCLWDPRFLVFDEEDASKDGSWLETLLAEFVKYGTRIIPVIELREKFHRASVLAGHAHEAGSGLALKIGFDDIQDYDLLESVRSTLRVDATECVLIVDISEADISEPDEFARSLLGWLIEFRSRGNWAKMVVTGSSFPFKNPAPPMGDAVSPRLEWRLWEWMVRLEPALRDFAIFGDFGADNARFKFGGGGRPIPHLRYATGTSWLTVRGNTDFGSLRGVSKRISDSPIFSGEEFSEGDAFIANCGRGDIGTSDPTMWRAVNMNRHMTAIVIALAKLYNIDLPDHRVKRVRQESLFDEVSEQPELVS